MPRQNWHRLLLALVGSTLALASVALGQALPDCRSLSLPNPLPKVPGPEYAPPVSLRAPVDGAPVISAHTPSARSDESLYLCGSGFGPALFVWGLNAPGARGGRIGARLAAERDDQAFVTIDQREQDAPYLLWLGKGDKWSEPVRVNVPEPWWVTPDRSSPGHTVSLFGRNLTTLPDGVQAFVFLVKPGVKAVRCATQLGGERDSNRLRLELPDKLEPGTWEVWIYAGVGGKYGWGGPVTLTITAEKPRTEGKTLPTTATVADIQAALDQAAGKSQTVRLAAGTYDLDRTLVVPGGVKLLGAGAAATVLRMSRNSAPRAVGGPGGNWGEAPQGIHTPGDTLVYELNVPTTGEYAVWMRYGTDMKPWNIDDMGGHSSLRVDAGEPVKLMNLPNTGSFAPTAWSKAAILKLTAGKHQLTWRNDTGGGLSIDAYVFARDPNWQPGDAAKVTPATDRLVLQGEAVVSMATKEARLPGNDVPVVWLAGSGAALHQLALLGSQYTNVGVLVTSLKPETWLDGAELDHVTVADVMGKQGENCGVLIRRAMHLRLDQCRLTARAPIFMQGLRQGVIYGNELTSVTRFGGNAEAAILGRTDTLSQCVIEGNMLRCPYPAGGPTQRRMIWVSTGHGSVDTNYFGGNTSEPMQFGGVAGTDQNVGEMILFEANQRVAYYGAPAGAEAQSVTLPDTAPFLPPDSEWEAEPALTSYYVQVVAGPGLGQVRRVTGHQGRKLALDSPWRVPPEATSVVVMSNLFARNIVADNRTSDGMTGIQLWIGCWDNIVTGNFVANQRRAGLFLYGTYTTADAEMKNTWNRGVGVCWFNEVVGNRLEECADGILLTSGESVAVASNWPRCLGNVIRHNTALRSRFNGLNLTSRVRGEAPAEHCLQGTIAEFNVLRDQRTGVLAGGANRGVLLRRNHVYFWAPWSPEQPPVGFAVKDALDAVVESNEVEDGQGNRNRALISVDTEPPAK